MVTSYSVTSTYSLEETAFSHLILPLLRRPSKTLTRPTVPTRTRLAGRWTTIYAAQPWLYWNRLPSDPSITLLLPFYILHSLLKSRLNLDISLNFACWSSAILPAKLQSLRGSSRFFSIADSGNNAVTKRLAAWSELYHNGVARLWLCCDRCARTIAFKDFSPDEAVTIGLQTTAQSQCVLSRRPTHSAASAALHRDVQYVNNDGRRGSRVPFVGRETQEQARLSENCSGMQSVR